MRAHERTDFDESPVPNWVFWLGVTLAGVAGYVALVAGRML
jgi:hypothetical protein